MFSGPTRLHAVRTAVVAGRPTFLPSRRTRTGVECQFDKPSNIWRFLLRKTSTSTKIDRSSAAQSKLAIAKPISHDEETKRFALSRTIRSSRDAKTNDVREALELLSTISQPYESLGIKRPDYLQYLESVQRIIPLADRPNKVIYELLQWLNPTCSESSIVEILKIETYHALQKLDETKVKQLCAVYTKMAPKPLRAVLGLWERLSVAELDHAHLEAFQQHFANVFGKVHGKALLDLCDTMPYTESIVTHEVPSNAPYGDPTATWTHIFATHYREANVQKTLKLMQRASEGTSPMPFILSLRILHDLIDRREVIAAASVLRLIVKKFGMSRIQRRKILGDAYATLLHACCNAPQDGDIGRLFLRLWKDIHVPLSFRKTVRQCFLFQDRHAVGRAVAIAWLRRGKWWLALDAAGDIKNTVYLGDPFPLGRAHYAERVAWFPPHLAQCMDVNGVPVEHLMNYWSGAGLKHIDFHTVWLLVKALLQRKAYHNARDLCLWLLKHQDRLDVAVKTRCFAVLADCYCRDGDMDKALDVLRSMKEEYQQVRSAGTENHGKSDEVRRSVRGSTPPSATNNDKAIAHWSSSLLYSYTSLINAFCNLDLPHRATSLVDDLSSLGLAPTIPVLTPLVAYYSRAGDKHLCIRILEKLFKTYAVKPDIRCLSVLFSAYVEAYGGNRFHSGESERLRPVRRFVEDLEGLQVHNVCYAAMIHNYLLFGDVEMAERVFAEFIEEGQMETHTAVIADIMGMLKNTYKSRGDWEKAEAVEMEVRQILGGSRDMETGHWRVRREQDIDFDIPPLHGNVDGVVEDPAVAAYMDAYALSEGLEEMKRREANFSYNSTI
ncbi:hypothetical protein HDU85_003071 [Gaertneriomyces sp. JEL0708]|nr:hypothetical protein HDU85_003071 [Gaertneriomyces sp. JEL0708]